MKEKIPRCASCYFYSPIEGERCGFCMKAGYRFAYYKFACNRNCCIGYVERKVIQAERSESLDNLANAEREVIQAERSESLDNLANAEREVIQAERSESLDNLAR